MGGDQPRSRGGLHGAACTAEKARLMAAHKALPGYKVRTTKRGYRVVELDAWADPARDESWLAEARRRSPTESDFQREVLRSWETVQGDAYYAEAAKIRRERGGVGLAQR